MHASYAQFCWEAEDDDEDEEAAKNQCVVDSNKSSPKFVSHWPPLATAS